MSSQVTVLNYTPLAKGSKVAELDVLINKWHFEVRFLQEFRKGDQRWFSFPSKYIEAHDQKRFVPYCKFEFEATGKGFDEELRKAVDAYLAQHPEAKPIEPVFAAEEELPF
jgi:hypothetical protein